MWRRDLRLYHHRAVQCGLGICQLNGRKIEWIKLKIFVVQLGEIMSIKLFTLVLSNILIFA